MALFRVLARSILGGAATAGRYLAMLATAMWHLLAINMAACGANCNR